MTDAIQRQLFPERVQVRCRRRIATGPGVVRWRWESLSGTVERRWRDLMLVQFDGKKRDGSARGCLVQVAVPPSGDTQTKDNG